MLALVAGIHVIFAEFQRSKAWVAGQARRDVDLDTLDRTLPGVTYRTKICDENTSYINRLNYYES